MAQGSSSTGPAKAAGSTTDSMMVGYYRFTDIFFEWHKALPNQEDVSPLKALLAYTALVHPGHPLRKEGVNGIELYLGTFETGEMRLLFSSAQIEYIRYWLHAVGLTQQPIPIPSSEYLILPSDLVSCSPDVYSDPAVLKKAIKNIDKNNKRLRGTGTLLTSRRFAFEKARTLWAAKLGTWCAIDFEAWDMDHTLLTEFGWSLASWKDGVLVRENGHLIVKEYRSYMQKYVPNHREFYNFGPSEVVNRSTFKQRIQDLINEHRSTGPLFLVFHDSSQDIKYLKSDAVKAVERLDYILPDNPQNGEIYVVDTADLFSALEGDESNNKRALERVCRHLQIPTKFLHNAGNDAHYTLDALIAMASGDPVDQQREQRWPKRTEDNQPKVEFRDWEEDSDYSDLEGVMGSPVANGGAGNDLETEL
ncbi:hypothetical protein GY45DRAFT_1316760 [Cubamyces sp. BRFM 1775]|nr:hypothetical protein GY45DRAFT_1316760 [Cubamyces sp. BRFM 1775]